MSTPSLLSTNRLEQPLCPQSVAVVICTRNRGERIRDTIASLLNNSYPDFTLVVVDQSTDDSTERALDTWINDPRLQYIRSNTKGVGLSRNIGMSATDSDIVLMTDDDCEVPSDWVERMYAAFERDPGIAVVFCDVVPGPYDPAKGHIPVIDNQVDMVLSNLDDWRVSGASGVMGAGMGVRRSLITMVGGFDNEVGAGSRFRSGWDMDIGLRTLLKGLKVYRTKTTSVLHYGFRSHSDSATLMRGYMYGLAAIHAKLIKCGHWDALPLLGFEFSRAVITPFFSQALRLQRPKGLGRAYYLLKGFIDGFGSAVDRGRMRFLPPHL